MDIDSFLLTVYIVSVIIMLILYYEEYYKYSCIIGDNNFWKFLVKEDYILIFCPILNTAYIIMRLISII
jgi:hypothetical protein